LLRLNHSLSSHVNVCQLNLFLVKVEVEVRVKLLF
jgi:hypothetical protein